MTHILSKSTYLLGVQCKKALYLNKYHKDLKDEYTEDQKAIFAQGNKVGRPPKSDSNELFSTLDPMNEIGKQRLKEGIEKGDFRFLKLYF